MISNICRKLIILNKENHTPYVGISKVFTGHKINFLSMLSNSIAYERAKRQAQTARSIGKLLYGGTHANSP